MERFSSAIMTYDNGAPDYTVEEAPDGFAICQHGMAIETPGGHPMVVPNAFLADTVLEEILSRGGKRDPGRTPMTEMALTAIDVIRPTREDVINQVMAYADSEMLCHRAEEPRALVKEQTKVWQPILEWAAKQFKAPLKVGTGVMPIEQPKESLANLRRVLSSYNDFYLLGIIQAAGASGSLILSLALAHGQMNANQIFDAAELDTQFQMESWGGDPDAESRHAGVRAELVIYARWFSALAQRRRSNKTGAYEPAGY